MSLILRETFEVTYPVNIKRLKFVIFVATVQLIRSQTRTEIS